MGAEQEPAGMGSIRGEEEWVEIIDEEEADEIGDLGNEFDDPEGWMSEREDYWARLANAPSRRGLLLHRFKELLRELFPWMHAETEQEPGVPREEWLRLYDECFGGKQSAQDDARALPVKQAERDQGEDAPIPPTPIRRCMSSSCAELA
ncbi:MAG: hypothetical protein QM702_11995 [Rubrivivax sp.]